MEEKKEPDLVCNEELSSSSSSPPSPPLKKRKIDSPLFLSPPPTISKSHDIEHIDKTKQLKNILKNLNNSKQSLEHKIKNYDITNEIKQEYIQKLKIINNKIIQIEKEIEEYKDEDEIDNIAKSGDGKKSKRKKSSKYDGKKSKRKSKRRSKSKKIKRRSKSKRKSKYTLKRKKMKFLLKK